MPTVSRNDDRARGPGIANCSALAALQQVFLRASLDND